MILLLILLSNDGRGILPSKPDTGPFNEDIFVSSNSIFVTDWLTVWQCDMITPYAYKNPVYIQSPTQWGLTPNYITETPAKCKIAGEKSDNEGAIGSLTFLS